MKGEDTIANKHKSYKRIHTYKYESDVERGKIKKEQTHVKKHRTHQKKLLKRILDSPTTIDDEILDDYETSLHAESIESNNAKTHKERLKDLMKQDKID